MTIADPTRTLKYTAKMLDTDLPAASQSTNIATVEAKYATAISPTMAALIEPGNSDDPIARQFIPSLDELNVHSEELFDPIGDHAHSPVPGIVHRYRDRALLKIVSVCPVYCRFCFRREMVGPQHGGALDDATLNAALAYLGQHPEISEVIMTGGDPLILSPRRIHDLTRRLTAIPHIRKLRWHTRVPVVTPERVTKTLAEALTATPAKVRVAIHANHPREFTAQARAACRLLNDAGVGLLSQSVLLRGINDDVATLQTLLAVFQDSGITPYYLHHGDLAPGTSHFRTSIADGMTLMAELAAAAPAGPLPSYILDLPGGHGKVPINSENFAHQPDGSYLVTNSDGQQLPYRDVL